MGYLDRPGDAHQPLHSHHRAARAGSRFGKKEKDTVHFRNSPYRHIYVRVRAVWHGRAAGCSDVSTSRGAWPSCGAFRTDTVHKLITSTSKHHVLFWCISHVSYNS